jgi:hypothetical protein
MSNRKWVLVVTVALFLASVVYSPHHVSGTVEKVDRPITFGFGPPASPIVTRQAYSYVTYDFIWEAPANSSLYLSRLLVTWLGIGVVSVLALSLTSNSTAASFGRKLLEAGQPASN